MEEPYRTMFAKMCKEIPRLREQLQHLPDGPDKEFYKAILDFSEAMDPDRIEPLFEKLGVKTNEHLP